MHAQARQTRSLCRSSEASSQTGRTHGHTDAQTAAAKEGNLFLFNTMSGKKQTVCTRSERENKLSMYCCGVTVYDLSHIGKFRSCPLQIDLVPSQFM